VNNTELNETKWQEVSLAFETMVTAYLFDRANDGVLVHDMPHYAIGKRFFTGERTSELYYDMQKAVAKGMTK
jgi:hypothetical protein